MEARTFKERYSVKQIPLTQGYVAYVDDSDYEELSKHSWFAMVNPKQVYAARRSPMVGGVRHMIYMHRQLLGLSVGDSDVVDHRDGNGLINCRYNIRRCTHRKNIQNRRTQKHSSKYKGVSWNKRQSRWYVGIKHKQKTTHLGTYLNEEKAAKAYDKKAIELFGDYANTNF